MIDTHDRVLKTHQLINGSKAVDEFKRLCTVCCLNLATAFINVMFCNYSIYFSGCLNLHSSEVQQMYACLFDTGVAI